MRLSLELGLKRQLRHGLVLLQITLSALSKILRSILDLGNIENLLLLASSMLVPPLILTLNLVKSGLTKLHSLVIYRFKNILRR